MPALPVMVLLMVPLNVFVKSRSRLAYSPMIGTVPLKVKGHPTKFLVALLPASRRVEPLFMTTAFVMFKLPLFFEMNRAAPLFTVTLPVPPTVSMEVVPALYFSDPWFTTMSPLPTFCPTKQS